MKADQYGMIGKYAIAINPPYSGYYVYDSISGQVMIMALDSFEDAEKFITGIVEAGKHGV